MNLSAQFTGSDVLSIQKILIPPQTEFVRGWVYWPSDNYILVSEQGRWVRGMGVGGWLLINISCLSCNCVKQFILLLAVKSVYIW